MSLEGQQLGHYRLQQLIGSGGMGEVYLAEDPRLHRQVAIKVVRNEASPYPHSESATEASRLFLREAKVIARLDHTHILPLYDFGEEIVNGASVTFLVMPYRAEGSLAQWLAQRGGSLVLSPDEALHIVEQAASALQYAHDSGIIHQDVKPANFLLRHNRENPAHPDLLLSDFGVAKFSTGTSSASQSIRGTPTYMAPEQWSANPQPATDQYALGMMAYELLAGRPPFQGSSMQMMYFHLHTPPPPPGSINPRLSPAIDAVILRSLAKTPTDRFPSVATFAQSLRLAMQPQATPADARGDLHATLAISQAEAQSGTRRTLTLPGGRQVTVTIPAGVQDGQVLRLEGSGEQPAVGGRPGVFLLRLSISGAREGTLLPPDNDFDKTLPASDPRIRPQVAPPPSRRSFSTSAIALVALAVLVVLAGAGLLYAQVLRPGLTGNATATSTAQASFATSLAITATSQQKPNGTSQTHSTPTTQSTSPAGTNSPYGGTLVLNDPLSSNSAASNWQTLSDNYGACTFTGNAYHISYSKSGYYLFCTAQATDFGNFAYQVNMTIVQGDMGGIVFRVDSATNTKFYYFHINTSGSYGLDLYVDNTRKNATSLDGGYSSAIHTSLFQTNVIAVVAVNNRFVLYVNNTRVTTVIDPYGSYSHGQIGLIADGFDTPTEVVFTNAKVWAM